MPYLFIGSANPVKINAVRDASVHQWPEVQIQSIDVESGVSEQPYGDDETRTGARNRAVAALQQGTTLLQEEIDRKFSHEDNSEATMLGIGLEGGVVEVGDDLFSTVWVAVTANGETFYEANGARFPVHPLIAEPIRNGEEMGPIVAQLVGVEDVRKKQGMIGVITGNFVTRTQEYTGIAQMAIGQWYGRRWHEALQ